MIDINLIKEAQTPMYLTIEELEAGVGFEVGGIYYAKKPGPTYRNRGSEKRMYPVVRLDDMSSSHMDEDVRVRMVKIKILIEEVEE